MGRLEKLSVAIGQLNPASSSPSHSNGSNDGGIDIDFGKHRLDRWQSKDSKQSEKSDHDAKTSLKRRKLVRQKESINLDQE